MAALAHYNFTTDFQDELLACMLKHPQAFIGMNGVLDYGYFTGNNSQMICRLMLEFAEEHKTFPTFATLGNLIQQATRRTGESDRAVDATAYVSKLSELEIRAKDYYQSQVVNFAIERALVLAATDVADNIKAGKEHGPDLVKKFQKALAIGQNLSDKGYLLGQDYQEIIKKVTSKDYGTATGYDLFDTRVWKRGWGPGWLIVPLAPPKRFKTAFCLNLALNMAGPKLGHDVLYYACEIASELGALRVYQNLVGGTVDECHADPQEFMRKVYEGINIRMPGEIYLKHFPAKTATINDIRNDAIQTIETTGINPKAIFIDYADTIKPSSTAKETKDYRAQADIYTEARALGDEFKCPIIMPDRCNRETVNQATPSMDSFQGAFEKGGIVDVGLGLCATDEEYDKGDLRFFVFLDRHGEGGIHMRGKIDKARMRISVDEMLKDYEEAEVEAQVQAQREKRFATRGGRKGKSKESDPRLQEEVIAPNATPKGKPIRV